MESNTITTISEIITTKETTTNPQTIIETTKTPETTTTVITDLEFEKLKLVYTETGEQQRYFLSWRHQLLAGYFVVFASFIVAYIWCMDEKNNSLIFAPLVLLGLIAITYIFKELESRNRELYQICQGVGRNIERVFKLEKLENKEEVDKNDKKVMTKIRLFDALDSSHEESKATPHSTVINWTFWSIIILVTISLILTICYLLPSFIIR